MIGSRPLRGTWRAKESGDRSPGASSTGGFSQLSKRLAGSHAKDVGAALPNMVRPIASNEDAAELASSLSGLIKKIDCYIEMIEKIRL